jgi:hypothetical protein
MTCLAGPALALEVTAGDYEIYPAGVNIGLLYYQHAQNSSLYADSNKVSDDFRLKTDVGLLRYIRPVKLTDIVTLDLNVILPFGRLSAGGDAAFLGDASGIGDLILGAPVKFLLNAETKDAFSIGTFVYLPTGSYDQNKPLNLGANRWAGLLQLAYVGHFGPSWALDAVGDVQVFGNNDKAGAASATLKQDPRYEVQAHLRYMPSPATAFSVGVGHYWGAEQEINGVAQDNKVRTTYGRLTASHFLDQTTQLQIQLGRDLKVESGFRESSRVNLRLAKIF